MVRICDVQKALEARGYPRPLKGALHLRVRDELIEQNDGAWVLEVEGGSGRLRAGGEGTLGVDIGALATLFSGHMSPRALRALGRVQGSEESLDLAQAIFAGPAPSMPDMF